MKSSAHQQPPRSTAFGTTSSYDTRTAPTMYKTMLPAVVTPSGQSPGRYTFLKYLIKHGNGNGNLPIVLS